MAQERLAGARREAAQAQSEAASQVAARDHVEQRLAAATATLATAQVRHSVGVFF